MAQDGEFVGYNQVMAPFLVRGTKKIGEQVVECVQWIVIHFASLLHKIQLDFENFRHSYFKTLIEKGARRNSVL